MLLVLILLSCASRAWTGHVEGVNYTQAKALYTELFVTGDYNTGLRPILNQSEAINVTMDIYLLSLNELNEVSETLSTTAFLMLSWNDVSIQWNLSDYGIDMIQWPQNDIWLPDISLKNSNKQSEPLGLSTMKVESWNSGWIYWYPFEIFESTCSMDITYFPFDVQTCELKFVAWSYISSKLLLTSGDYGLDLSSYAENSEWDLLSTSDSETDENGVSTLIFELKFKRKPMHVILAVILPIVMLSILNICVFVLPCDSGERAGYSMTVFLAFAVFLTIVSSTLPENSESVAVFAIFLIIQTMASTCITIVALIMLRYNGADHTDPVPKWLVTFLRYERRLWRCPCRCRRKSTKVAAMLERGTTKVEPMAESSVDITDYSGRSDVGSSSYEDQTVSTEDTRITWKEAINQLDRVLFIFFLLVTIASTAFCFTIASVASAKLHD